MTGCVLSVSVAGVSDGVLSICIMGVNVYELVRFVCVLCVHKCTHRCELLCRPVTTISPLLLFCVEHFSVILVL